MDTRAGTISVTSVFPTTLSTLLDSPAINQYNSPESENRRNASTIRCCLRHPGSRSCCLPRPGKVQKWFVIRMINPQALLTCVLDDLDNCVALRDHGRWLDDSFKYWQPPGCMMHEYNSYEIEQCLNCSTILFGGDSTIRQLFWATAGKINKTKADHLKLYAAKHEGLSFEEGCNRLRFLWDPYLNSSMMMYDAASRYTSGTAIVLGGGLWYTRYLAGQGLSEFKSSFDQLSSHVPSHAEVGKAPHYRPLLVAPVLFPAFEELNEDWPNRTLASSSILDMNGHLRHIEDRNVGIEVLWAYEAMLQGLNAQAYDDRGIHPAQNTIVAKQADVLLNLRCNAPASDKTCCSTPYRPARGQIAVLSILTAFVLYWGASTTYNGCDVLVGSGVPAGAGLYCYLTDRSGLFAKLHKAIDELAFLRVLAIGIVSGLLSICRSQAGPQKYRHTANFLSRQQTEEWKGWMQLVVLLYHYFGMSQVLWVYQLVRLMVASYLFMTGYGHAVYFLKTQDFSMRRSISTLLRLNILSIILAYTMGTSYEFYYFPGLCSFWYIVLYITLRGCIGHKRFLICALPASACIVRFLILRSGVLEAFVRFLPTAFRMQLNVHELRFRIGLDLYVVYVGMLLATFSLQNPDCALPMVEGVEVGLEKQEMWYTSTSQRGRTKRAPLITIAGSFLAVLAYIALARQFPDKYSYNAWHPILSPVVILAYVCLRNATTTLRSYHSRGFAWLGRCSLETFVLQYHIWLAADTKGLLSMGTVELGRGRPDVARWTEFVILTGIFLWTSWHVSCATNTVTKWFVDDCRCYGSLWARVCMVLGVLVLANWFWQY